MMAFLNRGLEIRFSDKRDDGSGPPSLVTYRYEGGISDFVEHINAPKESLFSKVGYFANQESDQEVEIAFQWSTGFNTDGLHSFHVEDLSPNWKNGHGSRVARLYGRSTC